MTPDGDMTLGSPRRRYRDDDDEDDDEDDVTSRPESSGGVTLRESSRRNKRKNFRPRNIVYNPTDDDDAATGSNTNDNNGSTTNNNNIDVDVDDDNDNDDDEDSRSGLPLNLSAGSESQLLLSRKTLMPRRHDNPVSSPIDLSLPSGVHDKRLRNLSVVRPEILFGGKSPPSHDTFPMPGMHFGPSLAALAAAASASERHAAAQSMKEAFQGVLKLYGVPPELAEAIIKNANNCTPGKTCI